MVTHITEQSSNPKNLNDGAPGFLQMRLDCGSGHGRCLIARSSRLRKAMFLIFGQAFTANILELNFI
jgi:hypothetical protein